MCQTAESCQSRHHRRSHSNREPRPLRRASSLSRPSYECSNSEQLHISTVFGATHVERNRSHPPAPRVVANHTQRIVHNTSIVRYSTPIVAEPKRSNQRVDSDSDNSNDSDDDLDDDFDSDHDANSESNETDLAWEAKLSRNHKLQRIREDLFAFLETQVQSWMDSAHYVSPTDIWPQPAKRARILNQQPGSTHLSIKEHDKEAESHVAPTPVRDFHLSCPFFASDCKKFQACLLKGPLRTTNDVLKHLRRHHMKPLYCPICHETFSSIRCRDDHISRRACEICDSEVNGIDDYQWNKILRRAKRYLSETTRWKCTWAVLFPHSRPPPTIYLQEGPGLNVSMIRDYWDTLGAKIACRFLDKRLHGQNLHEDTIRSLSNRILKDLLEKEMGNTNLSSGSEIVHGEDMPVKGSSA